MNFKSIFQVALLCTFTLTSFAASKRVLRIEVRSPKSLHYDADTYLAFGTEKFNESDSLFSIKQSEDNKFTTFEKAYELISEDHRHAAIIYINRKTAKETDQVFLLPIPRKSKATDWTNWKHADYVETNAVSNFIFNYTPADRSTNAPPSGFELRYKIE